MSNLAKIVKASKDPRCIMSVVPTDGGTWASSISSITPQPVTAGADLNEPNMSKRLKLLELTNTDTSGGVFKRADLTQPNWYGKTALSFAGRSTSFTVIGKMYIAPDDGSGNDVWHILLSQGNFLAGPYNYFIFGLTYRNDNNRNSFYLTLSQNDSSRFPMYFGDAGIDYHNKTVTVAVFVDYENLEVQSYIDGIKMSSGKLLDYPLSADVSNQYNYDAIHLRSKDIINKHDEIHWAMVFDGVLPDATIKYLST